METSLLVDIDRELTRRECTVAVSYAAVPDWTARHSQVSSTEALRRGSRPACALTNSAAMRSRSAISHLQVLIESSTGRRLEHLP